MARLAYRLLIRPTLALGELQAWLAEGWRQGTAAERVLIWPSWRVVRTVFVVLFAACEKLAD